MRTSKFFRFTISSETIDFVELKETISLNADLFQKGVPYIKRLGDKEILLQQSTNRWVYSDEITDTSKAETFLMKNLLVIKKHLIELKPLMKDSDCSMELIIYAGDKTDFSLTPRLLKILNDIGIKLNISFC